MIDRFDRERAMGGGFAGPMTAFTAVVAVATNAAAGPMREGAYVVRCLTNAMYVQGPTDRATALAATTGRRVAANEEIVVYSDGDNSATGHSYLAAIRIGGADATAEIVGISENSAAAAPPAIA